MTIGLATAEAIIDGAKAESKARGFNPLSIVVLDTGGHVVAGQREDGAAIRRYDIAYAKAYGAVALGVNSRDLMARAEQQPYFIASATAAIGGRLVPVPGGVLMLDAAGATLGAVGVSGDTSDNDEAAAIAGIHAAGLTVMAGVA